MNKLHFSCLNSTSVVSGEIRPPDGIFVSDETLDTYFDSDGLSLISLVVSAGFSVPAMVLASWLYDRFIKNDSDKSKREVKVNEKRITVVSRDMFIEVIEREIKCSEEN